MDAAGSPIAARIVTSIMNDEEKKLLKQLGLSQEELLKEASVKSNPLHPALKLGLGTAFIFNVGLLLSLPPVLRGRGAPYLPTFRKNLDAMFGQLRSEPTFVQRQTRGDRLGFVDLGSGDGRVVFRAAREQLFRTSIGYELNPLLHIWASVQRMIRGPEAWSTTQFHRRDLWDVDLRNDADVVAVYGLGPIMKDLSVKLKSELKPGSYVLSNVFSFPGWKPLSSSSDGTFLYKTPDCWRRATVDHAPTKKQLSNVTR